MSADAVADDVIVRQRAAEAKAKALAALTTVTGAPSSSATVVPPTETCVVCTKRVYLMEKVVLSAQMQVHKRYVCLLS
jgi:hypothetical protein